MNDVNHKGHIRNIALGTVGILLIPFIAMFFTEEVQWGFMDFVIMGALIFGTGLAYEFTSRKLNDPVQRVLAGVGFFLILFTIWVELATDGVSRALGL